MATKTKTVKKIPSGKKLVIVESPTKARTISKFLGNDFIVESSYGHVRDLPKSRLGIDTENNFQPSYIVPIKARKRVKELKKLAEKSSEIILASDEDREGEAIAWHLTYALGIDPEKQKTKRIVFHEITKTAIDHAIGNPRDIDMNLVDAQQARRILDRLVGYELSPFLWKKVFRGLSAGRVQSVAVRLVVDREREIEAFKPQEYWGIEAELDKNKENFIAKLYKKDDRVLDKLEIKSKQEADNILGDLKNATYKVTQVEKKESRRMPSPPFTTSSLQQEASSKLRYGAKQTMMLAQQLYEQGYISYMRTDSVNLSNDSLIAAKKFISENYGKEFSLEEPRRFKTKAKGAQEAHEAIRPTEPSRKPDDISGKLDAKQYKLYDLIWRRFIACQMQMAVFDSTTVDIAAANYIFRANGSVIKFEGWLKVYPSKFTENILPLLVVKDILELIKILPSQHFTEPPPRYNEASLIKTLEENGIGRPSTYAPTITTIQTRHYVAKNDQKRFMPTETGLTVNDLLTEHFPEVVNIKFTATMEERFDEVAEGKEKWVPMIKSFYGPFHKNLENKMEKVEKQNTDEKTDEVCEKCGKPMIIKMGRFGKFMACSGFPDCKNTKKVDKEPPKSIGMTCPKCGKHEIVIKHTKRKRIFYGCPGYPECDYASWKDPTKPEEEEGE
ncbi:MAG: type I DNA topoisomerase [Candidatus Terrybacteria bacterium CG10_big_fil_rev_8_21_14_0_10_41_10]|uniref:DNA topoisomerase 1 n=1 Tax=Candidatus Terrybacteria bacterium CG10_big_fil_rev_8_21_14_0_10_41_10 TaxID=1975026 RepID=A0A2M8LAL9_9BACT|nr:MAG: type I DNA topoisomerase [Candidatus Terrybacteria bacterium CG10_big_fil_rev_8_21_14_0_10_41_10]